MKRFGILFIVPVLLLAACQPSDSNSTAPAPVQELVVYTYDSFAGEWGPGPKVFKAFEEKTGIKVRVEAPSDANDILVRLEAEKAAPKADIVLGLDSVLALQAAASAVLEAYVPSTIDRVPASLRFAGDLLVPYDYGYFGIIYDSEVIKNPPASLEDLCKPEFKGKLILLDPRSSSPGLGFLTWTMMVYGKDWPAYWERLKPSILTVAPGWSEGYGAFTKGEAPLVLSYTTSPVYHKEFEQTERYKAAVFNDGHVLQVEGAGLVKGAPHAAAARAFLDFVLEEDFQKHLALSNIMYPASSQQVLPESFAIVPPVANPLRADQSFDASAIREAVDAWVRLMAL